MRVCVVGAGGREHALADVLSRTAEVVVTPGNAGIPQTDPRPPEEIGADLYVIGPEAPLVDGLADRLRAAGGLVFGPGADGARLEGSKAWMKEVLGAAGVATARHRAFQPGEQAAALAFLEELPGLYVIKTDSLAAGKGVLVTDSLGDAQEDVVGKLATGGIVIEEGLSGPELSVLAVCDGTTAVALEPARDHKRVGDGDTGPNTGGMGAFSPVAGVDVGRVMDEGVEPTLAELRRRGIDYRGVLYAGLMLTPDGPKMLEYNVRFGDPEAQVVLPRLSSDLAALLAEAAAGQLRSSPSFVADAAVCVVLTAEGYPSDPRLGDRIDGIGDAEEIAEARVYCAGVGPGPDGTIVTAGGRVLNVIGTGPDVAAARAVAYRAVERISWAGMHYRGDIGSTA